MMIEAGRRAAGILYAGTPTQPARFHASRSAPNAKSKAIGSRRGSIISVSRWRALRPWFRCASSGAPRPTSRKDRPTARRNPASGIPTATRSTFRSTDGRTESDACAKRPFRSLPVRARRSTTASVCRTPVSASPRSQGKDGDDRRRDQADLLGLLRCKVGPRDPLEGGR